MNNPSRIQFTNGNVTKYVYSATGEKLRTIHQTAAPNITVAMGTAHELTASELLYEDVTDYYLGGKMTVKNGRMDKYFFDGGYAQAKTNEATLADNFSLYYYNSDHLGNVREVIDEKDDVVQITNYYPFGTPYSAEDFATHNPDQQDHKYNGKEFDSTHGLNTSDYGARQYCSLFGRWDRMDPLCEKYYSVSPYAYCHNNPVMLTDPNGMDDFFDEYGKFIRRTEEGSAVMIMQGDIFKNITEVDFTNNESVIQNIGSHYLAKSDNAEFNLRVSSTGGDVPQDAPFSNNAGTSTYDLYLTDGHVNSALGNCYDFECITFHEATHRYDKATHGGTIGEANAVLRTATECPAWNFASDNYIQTQASYAASSLNKYINTIPVNIIQKLNNAFVGYATFELVNNKVSVSNLLQNCTVWGNRK